MHDAAAALQQQRQQRAAGALRPEQVGVDDLRELGVGALKAPMRFYGSDQIHSCHQKAVEAMGLGNRAHIVTPAVTSRGLLNVAALAGAEVLEGRGVA